MNTDIKDLIKHIRIKDPITIGAIICLVGSVVLFVFSATSFFRVRGEEKNVQEQYEAAASAIEKIRDMQDTDPNTLRQRVTGAERDLQKLMDELPTTEEATAELARYYEYASLYDTQLVRMEAVLPSPEEEAQTIYKAERFVLEARGDVTNLIRFLIHVAERSYSTFVLDNITISSGNPSVGEADLSVLYSSLKPGETPTPAGGVTSTP